MQGGALYYIDHADGKMIAAEAADEDEAEEDDVHHDMGGGYFRCGRWSDASVVRLECPDIEDAIENPTVAAEMAQAVIDTHTAESDVSEWRKLIVAIKAAGEAFADVDETELPEMP